MTRTEAKINFGNTLYLSCIAASLVILDCGNTGVVCHFTETLHRIKMTNQTIINWETGTIKEKEAVFIEFNNYLKELGLNIVFTQFSNSNYLSIYAHSIEDVENAKKIIGEKSSEVIDKFFSIVNKHGKVLKCDRSEWKDYSVDNIYSFEISCIGKVVRDSKASFTKELNTRLTVKPKYIFCHSAEEQNYSRMPGYYIVFDNPKDLEKIDENVKNNIDGICDTLLSQNDKTGFYARSKIEIKYFDTITNEKSLYGMSRED